MLLTFIKAIFACPHLPFSRSDTGVKMAESEDQSTEIQERIPAMQRLLDNHFLLLFLGVATPAVLYIIWGIMELSQIPIAE